MSDLMSLVQRLEALRRGRAVRITSHRHVAIRPHALVLAPLVLAGEETAVHVLALGGLGQPARIRYVADPRQRDDLNAHIFAWLSRRLERYYAQCLADGTYPQLWLSSGIGAQLITILPDRLRSARANPAAQRLGLLLTYQSQRRPYPGQQTLQAATEALRLHVATGQQAGEDEHLAALLTWIFPPAGRSIQDAVADAEREPSGIKTDPGWDSTRLAGLMAAYARARRTRAPAPVLAARAHAIGAALVPVVQPIYANIQRAIRVLRALPCMELPALARFEQQEAAEFAYYMKYINGGGAIAVRDSVARAAQGLATREAAAQLSAAVVRCEDRVARARARLEGHILTGRIDQYVCTHRGRNCYHIEFDLVSSQASPHVRVGDTIYWADNLLLGLAVTAHQRQGTQTRLHVVVQTGSTLRAQLHDGLVLDLTTDKPDWNRLTRDRTHVARVLAVPPWTHTPAPPPPPSPMPGPVPPDLLQAVENLR
jgi:hypothetical protein